MFRWTRLLTFGAALIVLAALFPVVSALGGLGPAELSGVLLLTLPAASVISRPLTALLDADERRD